MFSAARVRVATRASKKRVRRDGEFRRFGVRFGFEIGDVRGESELLATQRPPEIRARKRKRRVGVRVQALAVHHERVQAVRAAPVLVHGAVEPGSRVFSRKVRARLRASALRARRERVEHSQTAVLEGRLGQRGVRVEVEPREREEHAQHAHDHAPGGELGKALADARLTRALRLRMFRASSGGRVWWARAGRRRRSRRGLDDDDVHDVAARLYWRERVAGLERSPRSRSGRRRSSSRRAAQRRAARGGDVVEARRERTFFSAQRFDDVHATLAPSRVASKRLVDRRAAARRALSTSCAPKHARELARRARCARACPRGRARALRSARLPLPVVVPRATIRRSPLRAPARAAERRGQPGPTNGAARAAAEPPRRRARRRRRGGPRSEACRRARASAAPSAALGAIHVISPETCARDGVDAAPALAGRRCARCWFALRPPRLELVKRRRIRGASLAATRTRSARRPTLEVRTLGRRRAQHRGRQPAARARLTNGVSSRARRGWPRRARVRRRPSSSAVRATRRRSHRDCLREPSRPRARRRRRRDGARRGDAPADTSTSVASPRSRSTHRKSGDVGLAARAAIPFGARTRTVERGDRR